MYVVTNDMNPSPANMSNATYAAEMLALYKYNRTGKPSRFECRGRVVVT